MYADEERIPVVIAAGQVTEREGEPAAIELAERAGRIALEQAQGLHRQVDRVTVVSIMSPVPPSPAGYLAAQLGLTPAVHETSSVGGNTPQWMVNRAAADIAAGALRATLIVGAETQFAVRRRPEPPPHPTDREPDTIVGEDKPGVSEQELAIRLALPAHVYPMLESARAHRAGRDLQAHRDHLGTVMAPFTEVAAKHPHAWFPEARSAAEIATPTSGNRIIAEPYTKLMNAFPSVNQAAALLVTSLAAARAAGVADRAVFVWAGAQATDVWYPVQRPDLGSSPGIDAAVRATLAAAGVGVDDLSAFDLYSCFPAPVQMALETLGISPDDQRRATVTGGLPYFGGPGNNYVSHSIATMVDTLRGSGGLGLVTGLGWYVTKHAAGIYGTTPPPEGFRPGDTVAAQQAIDDSALPLLSSYDGEATVAGATVVYDKNDGGVRTAPVYATTPDGQRVAAAAAEGQLASLAGRNLVGARIRISGTPPTYEVVSA
jgi:acetyl-CoA C-acetyltransferase